MEEEMNYSTVIFTKNSHTTTKENTDEMTIYSDVKPASTAPKAEGEAAAHSQQFYVLAACSGILCVLLVGVIGAIIYISATMNEQKMKFDKLSAENLQMITENSILENKTEELRRDRDNLNWTLGVILTFDTFPVNVYCPQKKCQPCLEGWILFQEKCYLFWNDAAPWKEWESSRKHCKDHAADLVVIESLQEQEFITKHIEYYWDNDHGFWMGLLRTPPKMWKWVDGREVTFQYWIKEPPAGSTCALVLPGINRNTADWNVTASWDAPQQCKMQNKFICESDKVLIKPD